MNIVFEDQALADLFFTGSTDDKKYRRLRKDLVLRYVKVVNYMRAARRVEELFYINSLHYEKKVGNLKGMETVRINDQYRLLFRCSPDEQGVIVNALLTEISKHYE